MKTKILNYFPLGFNIKKETNAFFITYFASVFLFIFNFLYDYFDSYFGLFNYEGEEPILRQGAVIGYFHNMIDGCYSFFLPTILLLILMLYLHYSYHYQNSKSIYLMKRLPEKNELHKRCITFPVSGIIICYLTLFALIALAYLFYTVKTPDECIPVKVKEEFFANFTRTMFGGFIYGK